MVAALLLAGGCTTALAQNVALVGASSDKALLAVGAQPPRFVKVGDTHAGVKLLAVDGPRATIEQNGKQQVLVLGQTPFNADPNGAGATQGTKVTLTGDSRGHFIAMGQVNGASMKFLVDTGATSVSLGLSDALRAGLKPGKGLGQPIRINTANGTVEAWQTQLDSVKLGSVEVRMVTAVVMPKDMPMVLLGNSFLTKFQMQRNNDQLTLERRY
jgi:aspartyl protease family protein